MNSRDPSVNVIYGIMTMIYLAIVVVLNTLSIRLYQQEVLIPIQESEKEAAKEPEPVEQAAPAAPDAPVDPAAPVDPVVPVDQGGDQRDGFANIETSDAKTAKINKEAVMISEMLLMAVTIPLAFGYIIGFDCSCPPDVNHVSKIIFVLCVFIPMTFIIINEIAGLLYPSKDLLNPFLPPGSNEKDTKEHFFNRQYRKTFCWSMVTLTFVIHFFTVAFRQTVGGSGPIDII
tara:strand:+ start:3198 stop:3890 length:693 start_codon:yes stop_codon:yes gene_type:complete